MLTNLTTKPALIVLPTINKVTFTFNKEKIINLLKQFAHF